MEAVQFVHRRRFAWKTALLLVTTLSVVPILGLRHDLAGIIYVVFLAVIHVAGLFVFILGVSREDIAPSKWGFVARILGLVFLTGLLVLAGRGLHDAAGMVFWWSLGAIWAIHTSGLLLLHLRGRNETACPFV